MTRVSEGSGITSHMFKVHGMVVLQMVKIIWWEEGGIHMHQSWLTTKRVSREEGDRKVETITKVE